MNSRNQFLKYLISDYITAIAAWVLFYVYRKTQVEPLHFGHSVPIALNNKFFIGVAIIPLAWILLYFASGYYREVIRKSRLAELWYTMRMTLLGVVIIFFGLVLDDVVESYSNYYRLFGVLFMLQFSLTYLPRLIISTQMANRIHRGEVGFNTLIIGSNEKAVNVYNEILSQPYSTGNRIVGFISVNNGNEHPLSVQLPLLGNLKNIKQIIIEFAVEEVIIAIEYSEHNIIEKILHVLIDSNVSVKAIPGMYEIITGKVKMSAIMGIPLVEISHQLIPPWQENLKYFLDILFSLMALIFLFPLIVFLIIGVRLSSKGPILYRQERLGKNGKIFTILKFRSMYTDSEKNGPELSSENDMRTTPFGRFMRRSRLDEIPNFINVLKGDMSLVGPRPERKYYVDQIVQKAPQFIQLLKVRPGITSWGQVKYGYARNIDEMIRRMKYDLIYLDNMSLYVDFKIMIYTLNTILKRKGM
ncbi:MAG: sugar transferase [Bacteroidota bacterium]|nr:MAG: sugar transferase [Bacteroidota bacterium]